MGDVVVERRVSHREWDEVTIDAKTFMKNHSHFSDEGDGRFYDFYPTFNFENGTVFVDESWNVEDGRVSSSSYQSGVMNWDKNKEQYVKHCHFHETELGQLKSVTFTLTDELSTRIPHLLPVQS